MRLSFVILTYNRRDDLLKTLAELRRGTSLPVGQWEACVVDNASSDGTAQAVREAFAEVRLVRRSSNEGSIARNAGVEAARGRYVIFLDDDSYPLGETARRSVEYLENHPETALVGGRVVLPDGSEDGAAFPLIMPACALCVRKDVFRKVGGFSREFFRQAEEYDLIFRLLREGYRVERFEDLVYRHEKVPRSRNHGLIHQMDLRNNLILIERYLPRSLRKVYRADWLRRYVAFARHEGHLSAAKTAINEARAWLATTGRHERMTLDASLIEDIFEWDKQADQVRQWAQTHGVRRVVIADLTKNVYATYRACALAGLQVTAIADGAGAFAGIKYRGVLVQGDERAMEDRPDGVVISNVNPARVEGRYAVWSERFSGPVLRLWWPRRISTAEDAEEDERSRV